jgi:hypothetical protein
MRMLVSSLLQALPKMVDVMMLFIFFLLVFGIIGLQLFSGKLRQRCYISATGLLNDTYTNLCGLSDGIGLSCPSGHYCADSGSNSLFRGVISYDNIFLVSYSIPFEIFLSSIVAN